MGKIVSHCGYPRAGIPTLVQPDNHLVLKLRAVRADTEDSAVQESAEALEPPGVSGPERGPFLGPAD
jgi:hypothetical protein